MSFVTYLLVLGAVSAIVWPISWFIFRWKKICAPGFRGFFMWPATWFVLYLTNWAWLIDVPGANTMLVENGKIVRVFPESIIMWQGAINIDSLVSYAAFTKAIELTLPFDQSLVLKGQAMDAELDTLAKKVTWRLFLTIGGSPEEMLKFRKIIGIPGDSLAIVAYIMGPLKNGINYDREKLLTAYDLFYEENNELPCYELVKSYLLPTLSNADMKLKTATLKFSSS
ncbi:MAG: hypothetical protein WC575_00905 [Patescibacteria group bacterium]